MSSSPSCRWQSQSLPAYVLSTSPARPSGDEIRVSTARLIAPFRSMRNDSARFFHANSQVSDSCATSTLSKLGRRKAEVGKKLQKMLCN
uniref:Secreted protein n=1 Tax=Steinernema glaseri TaxID=37863 RepID=A0A1I7ZPM1_9BILA